MSRRLVPIGLLAFCGLPSLAVAAPARHSGRVVILASEGHGVSDDEARTVGLHVADALAAIEGIDAIHVDEIDAIAEQRRELLRAGCTDDAECMARLASVAGAPLALSISVGKIGTALMVNLALVDTATSVALARASETYAGLDDAFAGAAPLVASLVGGEGSGDTFRLPAGEELSLAVFDLATAGLADDVARNLSQVLTAQLAAIAGVDVISADDIRSIMQLEAQKLRAGCLDELECLAEIGGALGVDLLVAGHAGKLGSSYVVSLRLLAVNEVRVASRATLTFKGLEEQLLPAVRLAGRRLLGLADEQPGALALTSNEQEAEVFVDDEPVGTLPLRAIGDLSPGRHVIRISKEDFIEWRSDVFVEPGGTTPLWADLVEAPVDWYERWWVWTLVGVGVAAITGTALAIGLQPQDAPPASGEATLK